MVEPPSAVADPGIRVTASPGRPWRRRPPSSLADVADELLGGILPPLTHERLLGRQEIRAAPGVEPVGVGPSLVDAPPGVGPVVVDLAAEEVPSHAPHVLVLAEAGQVLVILEDRV